MPNPASVLRKTEAGMVAVKERDRSLLPRARTLLIMVDGSKSVAQLAAMNSDAVQGAELLDQLILAGFVEIVGDASSPAARVSAPQATQSIPVAQALTTPLAAAVTSAPVPVPAVAAAPSPQRPVRDLKTSIRSATRFLESWLGPPSESFCLQLERCKTQAEFEAKVLEIKLLLASARSVKKAEEFSAVALGA